MTKDQIIAAFEARFGSRPDYVVRAPGRVNLIGEHTDYNDGFVLPMAIDRAVWIALRTHAGTNVRLHSLDFEADGTFDLSDIVHRDAGWLEYIKGMASVLLSGGYRLSGWEGVVAGDIPIGAGLSSSAALELAAARAFAAVSDMRWDPTTMAALAQQAENTWMGMQCGIMDQLISAAGQAGHALLIDCRSLEIEPVPLPPDTDVVVMDTATRRALVDSAYNERRARCEAAAAFFGVPALRDLDVDTFEAKAGPLDPLTRKRARHVIYENDRTLRARTAMQQGDAHLLGRLMNESHDSLRDDFEVSSPALNQIVTYAQAHEGCYGARMTGAGFGGCGVALVARSATPAFIEHVANSYEAATGLKPSLYRCRATEGAALVMSPPAAGGSKP